MNRISKKDILLILLFEIGFGLTFNIVGSISASEIFLIFFAIIKVSNDSLLRCKEFKTIALLYILLIVSQCISEFMVENDINSAMKGIAITVVSFCHFYFLLHIFLKDRNIILWLILGAILRSVIWGYSSDGDIDGALTGEEATFLKFFLAPLIVNILMFVIVKRYIKMRELLFVYLGMLLVIAGARSYGMITLITGIVCIFLKKRTITNKQLLSYTIPIIVIGYVLYVVYVNNVLSGNIISGNNEQLLIVDNPYNPIYLLLAGRSEVFVGWMAFMDAPLWGHGSWPQDIGYHYISIVSSLHDKDFNIEAYIGPGVIPTHSVLIGYGTFNGIFALIILLYMMVIFFKQALFSLRIKDHLKIILVFYTIQLLWNLLFSPLSHFRQTLPLYMAFIFVTYLQNKNIKEVLYK